VGRRPLHDVRYKNDSDVGWWAGGRLFLCDDLVFTSLGFLDKVGQTLDWDRVVDPRVAQGVPQFLTNDSQQFALVRRHRAAGGPRIDRDRVKDIDIARVRGFEDSTPATQFSVRSDDAMLD